MSTLSSAAAPRHGKTRIRAAVAGAAMGALVIAMALDTRWARSGGSTDVPPGTFSPLAYGQTEFPAVQKAIRGRAVPASVLAAAIAKDPAAAAKQYGVASGVGVEYPVSFTGTFGDSDFGNYDMAVDGVPGTPKVAVQTGPAIMGTDLRDGTGTIQFGQFTNQIDYQNAGSALNKEMKKQVLSKLDTAALKGKAATNSNTVNGKAVHLDDTSGDFKVNDATVIQSDIKASNGTIQVIDHVLSTDYVVPAVTAATATTSSEDTKATPAKSSSSSTKKTSRKHKGG